MNIRKKVLFNPSNIRSTKADSSDNTTANTKNSAILEQSKTFRVTGCGQFVTQRSKNYLRSLSRQLKKQNSAHVQNTTVTNTNRPYAMPSYSTISNNNQHLPPLKKKSMQNRNLVIQSDQQSQLGSLKRPIVLSSQNDRKPPIFPSTHVNSNRDIGNPDAISRKQFHCQRKVPISQILAANNHGQQIERRKQQLNSMNLVGSLGASRHSVALSKFSLASKQSYRNQNNTSKNSDMLLSVERQQPIKPSIFVYQKQQHLELQEDELVGPQANITTDQMEESIVEEIERDKSINKIQGDDEQQANINTQNDWNNDNQQKLSLNQSKTVQLQVANNQTLQSSQSLCESQQIDQSQLQQKKNACRTPRNKQSQKHKKQYSFNKDQDFCLDTMKSQQQQSSLCQSYHMQTPVRAGRE